MRRGRRYSDVEREKRQPRENSARSPPHCRELHKAACWERCALEWVLLGLTCLMKEEKPSFAFEVNAFSSYWLQGPQAGGHLLGLKGQGEAGMKGQGKVRMKGSGRGQDERSGQGQACRDMSRQRALQTSPRDGRQPSRPIRSRHEALAVQSGADMEPLDTNHR